MSATRLVYTPEENGDRIKTHYVPSFLAGAVVADIAARYHGALPRERHHEDVVYLDGAGFVALDLADVVIPLGSYTVMTRATLAPALCWEFRERRHLRICRIGRFACVKHYGHHGVAVFLERDLQRVADALAAAVETDAPSVAAKRAELAASPDLHVPGVVANVEPF